MSQQSLVIAYVRRNRRHAVGQALQQIGMPGWSEIDVAGHGQAAEGRAVEHTRFEIVISSQKASACMDAIATAAHTGTKGDGLVLALPVSSVHRITDFTVGDSALREE